jgi:hypothetical protein
MLSFVMELRAGAFVTLAVSMEPTSTGVELMTEPYRVAMKFRLVNFDSSSW